VYSVYILKSRKDKRTYVGYTRNIEKRIRDHNSGHVVATKHRRSLVLLYKESCENLETAKQREVYWKTELDEENLQSTSYLGSRLSEARLASRAATPLGGITKKSIGVARFCSFLDLLKTHRSEYLLKSCLCYPSRFCRAFV
jgi:putative endonuclease